MGLPNKLILVTQKQVLELYITVIERKTLYGLYVPHTAFPNATEATTRETTNEVHVTKDRGIGTSQGKSFATAKLKILDRKEMEYETKDRYEHEEKDLAVDEVNCLVDTYGEEVYVE